MSLTHYILMLVRFTAVGAYFIDLKVVNFPCDTTQCTSMKICYSYDKFCNTGLQPKYCLENMNNNMIDIKTASAIKGESIFYEFKKEHDSGDSPTVLSVILNQQGEEVVYCEDTASRNESGSTMLVHFESTTTTSFIDVELKSNCEDSEHCTGAYCNRCYTSPPAVTISVLEPVIVDDNSKIVCRIVPLTRDTQILWLMSNETFSRAIHTSDKYQVSTSISMDSSILTIYSVQHEDELKYSCQAINFRQTSISNGVRFYATELSTENITSTDQNGTTTESNLNSKLTYTIHSTKKSSTMKINNTRISPSNEFLSTNIQKTSATMPIHKPTTLKYSSTSKYVTISSSVKGTSTATSGISQTTKSSTSLTHVESVNTTLTPSSVTIPRRNNSPAGSYTRNSATTLPTVKTMSTTKPNFSPITKTSAAPLCDKASSSTLEAIQSKVEAHFQKLVIIATGAIVCLEFVIIVLLICLVRRQKRGRLEKKTDEADTQL